MSYDAFVEKERRLHIAGLSESITIEDLQSRFSTFGAVKDITLAKTSKGVFKGFGHVTLTSTDKSYRSCMIIFDC